MITPLTIDSSAVKVTEISDPATADAGLQLIEMDAVQRESMPLRARRVLVHLGTASVLFHASNRRLSTSTSMHQGLLGYVTFGPQARGTVNGLAVRPGMMLVAAAESEARFVRRWIASPAALATDQLVKCAPVDAASTARLAQAREALTPTVAARPRR